MLVLTNLILTITLTGYTTAAPSKMASHAIELRDRSSLSPAYPPPGPEPICGCNMPPPPPPPPPPVYPLCPTESPLPTSALPPPPPPPSPPLLPPPPASPLAPPPTTETTHPTSAPPPPPPHTPPSPPTPPVHTPTPPPPPPHTPSPPPPPPPHTPTPPPPPPHTPTPPPHTPTPPPLPPPHITVSQCNTGSLQCCQSSQSILPSANSTIGGILSGLGLNIQDVAIPIGVTCSPISVFGGSAASCTAQPVCCKNNNFNGVVALGCDPVNLTT